MKKINFLLAMICGMALMSMFAFSPSKSIDQSDKGLSHVTKIDGIYVFVQSQPAQAYETSFEYKTVLGGFGCPTITEMAEASVKSAKKKGLPFDAIILGDGKTDLAIRFK